MQCIQSDIAHCLLSFRSTVFIFWYCWYIGIFLMCNDCICFSYRKVEKRFDKSAWWASYKTFCFTKTNLYCRHSYCFVLPMKRQCGRYRQGNPEIGQIAVLNCCRKVCPQFKVTIKPSDTAGTQINFVLVSLSVSAWQVCVHTRTAEPVRPVYINVKKNIFKQINNNITFFGGGYCGADRPEIFEMHSTVIVYTSKDFDVVILLWMLLIEHTVVTEKSTSHLLWQTDLSILSLNGGYKVIKMSKEECFPMFFLPDCIFTLHSNSKDFFSQVQLTVHTYAQSLIWDLNLNSSFIFCISFVLNTPLNTG